MTLVYEKKVPVFWVPTISDITGPTVAEMTAGDNLWCEIPKDGVQFPSNRSMVPTDSLCDDFDSESPGSDGGTLVITFKREDRDGNSVAWTLFKGTKLDGFLVFGFDGSAEVAADEVDVYQVESHLPVRANPGANTEQRFSVNFGVQQWKQGVAVAA